MSFNSYSNYTNNSSLKNNNTQSFFSYDQDNSIIQFESMLNNISEWQNNPIEATRLCFKYLYEINRSTQKNLEIIDKNKATKIELSTGLNTKGDLSDIMQTFNEVAQNMEQRPTKEELDLKIEDKINEEIKKVLASGDIKINLKKNLGDLNENFVNKKELREIIKNNKINNDNLSNLLNEKVNKTEINNILKDLKNFGELNEKVKNIDNDLDRLIDNMKKQFKSIDNSINNLVSCKLEIKDLESLNKAISENNKNNSNKNEEINNDIQQIKNEINVFNSKYNNLNGIIGDIKSKYEILDINLKNNENNMIKKIEGQIDIIAERINNNNLDNNDIQKFMYIINQNIEQINEKIYNMENKKYLLISDFENLSLQLKSEMKDIENYTKDYYKNFYEDLLKNINKKMDIDEAKSILEQKVDQNTFQKMINSKSSSTDIDNIKLTTSKLTNEIQNKLDIDKFDTIIESILSNIQEIKNDLVLKGNIDEIMSYLKNKASIDDVNKALVEIHSELDSKSSLEDFNHAMNNQNSINKYLAEENSIAKYIWKSGNISKGYAVPWEVQIVNTLPENFIWEKDDICITVKKKGIYLISLGFFVEEKPTVQVMINGESVLSQVNSNAFIVRQDNSKEFNLNSLGKIEDKEQNGYNCVTGLTMNEFLCLENMSKIVISYSGSNSVKGMMSIKQICSL